MPTLKVPTMCKALTRGTALGAAGSRSGTSSVTLSPTCTPSLSSRRQPTRALSPANWSSASLAMPLASRGWLAMSVARRPRTSTPVDVLGVDPGQRLARTVDAEIAVDADYVRDELRTEPVHHGHHDDQRRHAERDPQQREDGDHRDETLLAARPQIAECHHALKGAERHQRAESLLNAASGESSSRLPVLRSLSSTTPWARPRGPTVSCQGRPIRSMVANFAPGDSSRSS